MQCHSKGWRVSHFTSMGEALSADVPQVSTERKRDCVCVCVRERERERERAHLYQPLWAD
jgi:hypothetical protein